MCTVLSVESSSYDSVLSTELGNQAYPASSPGLPHQKQLRAKEEQECPACKVKP